MIPPSIYPDADVLGGAIRVLAQIDALPQGATGVLKYAQLGSVLVEAGRVCLAVAPAMQHRLTDLLRHQRNPPLDRKFLESVLANCQNDRRPLGEALLASGEISESGLRMALFRQTVEAIAHIARAEPRAPEFTAREGIAYDARFLFCTAEIFAALGARRDRPMAIAARRDLETLVAPDTTAIAFRRDDEAFAHPPLTVLNAAAFHVEELRAACVWAAGLLDVVSLVDPDAFLATGTWGEASSSAVVWRTHDLHFAALCPNRGAAAVLTTRLLARRRS